MKNSEEMCLPLFLPFECYDIDFRDTPFPQKPVTHYYAELLYLREGELNVLIDREETTVRPGEAVIFCPGTRHHLKPSAGDTARIALLRLDVDRSLKFPNYSADLQTILWEARRKKMPMVIPADETVKLGLPEIVDHCLSESAERVYGYDQAVLSWMNLISVAITRFWLSRGLKIPNRDVQPEPIYNLSGYILKNLKDGLRVEDLADWCGLSYPWFAKKFREIYGISCKDYIEQIRVSLVEQYLMFTDLDLAEISEITGYADCSHMIKNFKRVMDITPGQYRQRKNKN